MENMTNQVVLVTGASGTIGQAICRLLAQKGASLIVHYHTRSAQAESLLESLNQSSQQHIMLQADLSKEDEVNALLECAMAHFKRLDVVINNAGWTRVVSADNLLDLDDELLDKTLKLKIHTPIYLARAARAYLEASGQGQIINITSVAGIAAKGSSIIYAAANAALSNLTRSLARSLAPKIRVNAVAPGFVETGFAWPADGKVKAYVSQRNHIGRTVEAEEVAKVVCFLMYDAPAITGEEIVIDGGIGRLGTRS